MTYTVMKVEEKVALWLVIVVVVTAGLSVPVASVFPPRGNPWEAYVYPYQPPYGGGGGGGGGHMGDMYMNQASKSEIVSRCRETPKAYVYTLEVPGIKKEDVKVEAEEGLLKIKGEEKKTEKHGGEVNWSYGQFWKQIPLADDANTDNIKTDVTNGVLTVTVSRRHHRGKP